MKRKGKAYAKLLLIVLWVAICYVVARIARRMGRIEQRDRFVSFTHRVILMIVGVRVRATGAVSELRPLLLVSNHVSYMDVYVLGSRHPMRFTPKSDMAKWPGLGSICRACDAIFVDRRPEHIPQIRRRMHETLAAGKIICLFPEATTGNGKHTQPFKSGFFSLAEEGIEGRELMVQPVAITYTHIRRLPMDHTQWPGIAWYGDMELLPHVLGLLELGPIDAEAIFLPPVSISQFKDRKEMAAHCRRVIDEAIQSVRHRPAAI